MKSWETYISLCCVPYINLFWLKHSSRQLLNLFRTFCEWNFSEWKTTQHDIYSWRGIFLYWTWCWVSIAVRRICSNAYDDWQNLACRSRGSINIDVDTKLAPDNTRQSPHCHDLEQKPKLNTRVWVRGITKYISKHGTRVIFTSHLLYKQCWRLYLRTISLKLRYDANSMWFCNVHWLIARILHLLELFTRITPSWD